jgi:hypothetical protein
MSRHHEMKMRLLKAVEDDLASLEDTEELIGFVVGINALSMVNAVKAVTSGNKRTVDALVTMMVINRVLVDSLLLTVKDCEGAISMTAARRAILDEIRAVRQETEQDETKSEHSKYTSAIELTDVMDEVRDILEQIGGGRGE